MIFYWRIALAYGNESGKRCLIENRTQFFEGVCPTVFITMTAQRHAIRNAVGAIIATLDIHWNVATRVGYALNEQQTRACWDIEMVSLFCGSS